MDTAVIVYAFWLSSPVAGILSLLVLRDRPVAAVGWMAAAVSLFVGPFALAAVGVL